MVETLPLEGRYVLPRVAVAGKCGGTGSGEGTSCRRKRSFRFTVALLESLLESLRWKRTLVMIWGSIRFKKTFVLGMGMGMIRMAEVFDDASRAAGEIVVISGGFAGD